MLSMAFARDYSQSGRFYVYYTDNQGFLQIDQYRRSEGNPNRADPSSRRSVLRVPHPRSNHKGGQVQVGPDGFLYAGFGDGGGGGDPDENAQNLGPQLGKLIRIDPRPQGGYDVPGRQPAARPFGRSPRDLRLRATQPLPLLLRPHAREPGRSATWARMPSRRSPSCRAARTGASRAAATTSDGTCSRAEPAMSRAARPAICRR